jgi:feruloyl esterase
MAQQACENLKALKLDHATVVSAQMKAAETVELPPDASKVRHTVPVPAHCEVRGVARPTSDSEINFAVWLPPTASWNGKYTQQGNGGWAGTLNPLVLLRPLLQGYAAAATDDGHTGGGAAFAVGHPEKLIDFGYRALHETSVQAKAIIRAFYGKDPGTDYFVGCSDGGREALMEAQRYPEDFHGIIAGAPANHWTHHFTGFVWNEWALNKDPASNIPPNKLPAIEKAALSACDALDGVRDGLIEDPTQCHFDPSVLTCRGADGPNCLTHPQVEALNKIYAGPTNPSSGEQIYPGYEAGTEAEQGGWSQRIVTSYQATYGNSLYADAVFENPKWDWRTMDFDKDLKLADQKVGIVLNSYNPDLRSFRAHGGKLIQYHGWGDAAIAPRDSIAYYRKVEDFLQHYPDPRSSNASKPIQDFYRLFMVPGMGHCSGGIGPNRFGNEGFDVHDPLPPDPEHDVLRALDRWVTEGVAPDKIIGTGSIHDPADPSRSLKITRPLCPYPQRARYDGTGDPNLANSFTCVTPPALNEITPSGPQQ